MCSRYAETATAVVMNMFYTGLGIARSLGEQGISVIGLSSSPGVYGECTKYARILRCPDSRSEPEALLAYMRALGAQLANRAVVFPTRDDDVLFLDRNRSVLAEHFSLVIPGTRAVRCCLDKWETWLAAERAEVQAPKTWLVEQRDDLAAILSQVTFPCVVKPVSSYHWRRGTKWRQVGGRKAFSVTSAAELIYEYAAIAEADERVLIQEMIPGSDNQLMIVACYMDRNSIPTATFNTRKILQAPQEFGTGLIVQAADCPELMAPTVRLLRSMHFTGIAEVEYKWNQTKGCYQLIEVNPRPWDQHRLGNSCGVNLIHLAYCEHAGLPMPPLKPRPSDVKWIAEDAFLLATLHSLWKRDGKIRSLFAAARGRRCYAIWSLSDPLPFFGGLFRRFIPGLISAGLAYAWSAVTRRKHRPATGPDFMKTRELERGKSSG